MSVSDPFALRTAGAVLAGLCAVACLPAVAQTYGLGTPLSAAVVAPWNIDVNAEGAGLPKGRGSVAEGKVVFDNQCAACHGAKGEGGLADRLVGGAGTLASAKPVKTIGSFWPYATTLYDFVYRAMPYNAPQSLRPAEVYAVTAYLLHLNGIVPADTVLDAHSLPAVRMPNRKGFVGDPRPDTGPVALTGPASAPPVPHPQESP
ncbi:MAG: cytochrome c [Pseudomonadota bacterium]